MQPRSVDVVLGLAAVAASLGTAAWRWTAELRPQTDGPTFLAMALAFGVVYGATGALLARWDAAPLVRRVLLAIALTHGIAGLAGSYADAGLAAAPHWPGASWALWLALWVWSPAYVAVPVVLPLVLPDGRLVWRWSGWLAGAAVVGTALWWAVTPYHLQDIPVVGPVNPVGVEAAGSPGAEVAVALLVGVATLVAVASVAVRWRRAEGAQREQLRWLLVGVLATIAVGAAAFALPSWAVEVLPALAVLPFPAACLVALVRHRLWDVDLVLSRSLTYGLLSAGIVTAYVVSVSLLGAVLGSTAGAPVLATTVVALLVLPLHARLQRLANRLVHGEVEDPWTALARLGDRLEAVTGPADVADHVLPDLVAHIARALRVPYAAVALADGTTTAHGTSPAQVVTEPLVYGGVEVGRLVVTGTDLPRGERQLLQHLARQAAVAVHAVLLARAAAAARAGTATAREEERRRLRRDLHDGLGPALAAVALQAETARDLVPQDPAAAVALLDRLVPRLNEAVRDVRTLVHDLRPPTLDELGLAGSVRELATRFATPACAVSVDAEELELLPAAVDLAAYRIVSECLANASKHASASSVRLALRRSPSALQVEVRDDGVGLAPGAVPGVGLRSMRERAEELGGTCTVGCGEGGAGTTVVATLPLQRESS